MVPVIVLRLEFGVIILHLSSNEVNGLSNHHWGEGRQNLHLSYEKSKFLGLFYKSFSM